MIELLANTNMNDDSEESVGGDGSASSHWGGFRVGEKIAPLEGDVGGIMKAVSPVANQIIHNPQTPKPVSPNISNELKMAPASPGMGGGGASTVRPAMPANLPVNSLPKVKDKELKVVENERTILCNVAEEFAKFSSIL